MDYVTAKKNLKVFFDDIKNKPFKTICILLVIILITIIYPAIVTYVNGYVSKHSSSESPADNIYKPPALELSYFKNSEKLNEKGLYNTSFNILIHQPIGNFETGFIIGNKINNAKCSDPEWRGSGTAINGALASSTYNYEIKCESYKPIIETKELFFLLK
jgi:hypothetical protein